MNMSLILFILLLFVGFSLLFSTFTVLIKKYENTQLYMPELLPFPYIFAFYALGSLLLYFFLPNNDFIEPLTLLRVLLPLGLTVLIFLAGIFGGTVAVSLTVALSVTAVVLVQPLGEGFLYNSLPQWLARLILIVFFTVFCLFYKILNYLSQTLMAVSILMLLGMILLSVIGAAPMYISLAGALLAGALLAYLGTNFNSTVLYFDNNSAISLAFLISSLMLLNAGEFCLSSCLIFSALFWAELIYALWNTYLGENRNNLMIENTAYAIAAQKYTMRDLIINIFKIGCICLFIGWFQLFGTNQYSLFVVAVVFLLWFNNNLAENIKSSSLKEINSDFIADMKKNVEDVKETISTIKNQKDN